jgi:FMN phosphatase YigB (HAD superfamily)
MERERPSVVFFDIGDTLGTVQLNAAGDRIERIIVLQGVIDVLRTLGQRGARLGIISNRGTIPEPNVLSQPWLDCSWLKARRQL